MDTTNNHSESSELKDAFARVYNCVPQEAHQSSAEQQRHVPNLDFSDDRRAQQRINNLLAAFGTYCDGGGI